MARLIPRKQIEEQQNISGSLTIQQNVDIGNDAIVSGSLFVSQSFFLGNNTGSRNEITGSVFLTGSLSILGKLEFQGPEAILSATASNTLLAVDTQRYAGILAKDFGANVPTLYVSSTDGDDNNDGRSIQYPLRTIKRAASLASPGYDGRYGFDTGSIFNGYVIKVQAGTYLEDNPVILPKNTTIWGAGLRITKINAKTPTEDLFWVNSGCYIAEVTMGGLRLYPDQINPEKGFAVAFQPGAFITTSPYIQNCSQISNQENSFTELYEDIPPGGGGLYVNGDVIDPDSPLASMVLDAYTQISPNGVGCLVNGRGFIQLVSFFNNFSYYSIRVNNGGHATLNNSNISFGLYGMYASGSRFISGSGGNIQARDSVRGTWSCVVDVLNKGLEDGLPVITKLNTDEGIRLSQPSIYPQSTVSSNVQLSSTAAEEISSDFKLISEIVDKGTTNFPTLLARSSNKGYGFDSPYNILGAPQITSSIASASQANLNTVSESYRTILSIFANGTGSFKFTASADLGVKITDTPIYPLGTQSHLSGSVSSSFETIINIVKSGISAMPTLVSSNSASIYVGGIEPFTTGLSSSLSVVNKVSSSFSIIYNILTNGTGSNVLTIPNDHSRTYNISNSGSSAYNWENFGPNPTITLFRGETYKFFISASEAKGGIDYPFYIRTQTVETILDIFDYNKGVVNNGDSSGTITFTVPYDAPNVLYYTSQTNNNLSGKFSIVNNSTTPFDLISSTLTFPKTISGSNIATENVDILNAYEILTGSKSFIQEEVIQYVSSSWSSFYYDELTCRRDVGYLVDAVCQDLLYGGNNNSITAGRFYYEYPSEATTTQKDPTVTAVKYAAGLAINLVKNVNFIDIDASPYNSDRKIVADNLFDNKAFIQNETIAFLSSSWSNFYYNEEKCKRDTGYIIDAVITDLKYGGNERAITAGRFYYDYPSLAIVRGDGDGLGQLGQTLDGLKYAAGVAVNLVKNKTFNFPNSSTQTSYDLLRINKPLIQNETIQFINVAFPQLKYNLETCKRDVGYIIDAISTDLLYGGNERAVTAGRYYYDYPSLATSVQRRETSAGIRYAKIIGDYIIQNLILDTPRIIGNDEKNIRASNTTNETSSFSGKAEQQLLVSSSFGIIENIVLRGLSAIPSALALNTGLNWSKTNPYNISSDVQITNVGTGSYETNINGFDVVTNIIDSGSSVAPTIISNTFAGIKATSELQFTASNSASNSDRSIVSASFGNIINIITNGTGSIPTTTLNTNRGIKVTDILQITSSITPSSIESENVTNGFNLVLDIIQNGTGSLPTIVQNASNLVKRTNSVQFVSTASISQTYITSSRDSFNIISDIVEYGTGSLPTLVKNVNDLVRITDTTRYSSSYSITSSNIDNITSKFDTIIGILENGIASLPAVILNTSQSIKVTTANQYISASSATSTEATMLSASIAIVTNIVANGTGSAIVSASLSLPTSSYTLPTNDSNKWIAYGILKNNISFIQDETIAYLSSSWSTASYDEAKCRRDVGLIISGAAEDLIFNSNSASVFSGIFYYQYPSQAQGAQLNQTLDGINYASKLAQKVILNTVFSLPNSQSLVSRDILVNNKVFIQNETIAYLSSSWSSHSYDEGTCKRDIGHIIDAIATDTIYGGNERTINAGAFYYLYPSEATGSQIQETVTGINYSKNLADKLLRGNQFIKVSQNKLQAKQLIVNNKTFIQNEVIEYVSASWSGFLYNEETCKRDVGYILDAVITDLIYGGNERSLEAGEYYYRYPSQATTIQLGPTLAGIEHSKGLVNQILKNRLFVLPSLSAQTAFNLINDNKGFIQSESIAYVSSSWSFFNYNDISCSRDIGYILDAVATDTLYGGNERTAKAGEYYYLYPSDATGSQLQQTLDGVNYAKGITQKIVSNILLQSPTISELNGYELLLQNKKLIQSESITYLSSSWSTFEYNQTTCKRDLSYIIDAVATDLKYGGNQRTNKAGEYYYLYPSLAIIANTTTGQLEQTVDGVRFAAGISDKIISNTELVQPTTSVSASALLIRQNRAFIQNETIQYIDAFYPYLIYNREKCRRDTGYIIDAIITDLFYGGNERSVIAGKYYYEYPSLAITNAQKKETINGIEYAKSVTELVAQNIKLVAPILKSNTDDNIKATNTPQYTSTFSGSVTEVSNVSSSFKIVTDIIENGLSVKPIVSSSVESFIKVTNAGQYTSAVSASGVEIDIVTSSFKLIRDIIYNGSSSVPDSLVANFNYGFELSKPTTLHITSVNQILGSGSYDIQTGSVSSSFGTIINIVKNGTNVSPTLTTNTSASLKRTNVSQYSGSVSASTYQLNRITNGYDIILDIVENGYSVVPTLISNTSSSIKITDSPQLISGSSADRLQGKLISASFGLVVDILLNGTGSAPSMISGSGPNPNPKINAAYNLLLGNKSFIVSESIAYLNSAWSTFQYNQASCSRDLSGIIDGAATDLLYGGNSASLFNGKFYYEFPSQASGTGSQVQQTVTVLKYASQLAEKVVRNTLFTHISASVLEETSASYVSFVKNKEFIQNETIAYLSSSWSGFDYNEATCKRDIGYVIDAVATDLLYGGNERAIIAGKYYYEYPSQAITTQLEPTLTGIRFGKGTALNVVLNKEYFAASTEISASYTLLANNRNYIQSESVAFVNAKYPKLEYNESKCLRDVGYIVDAVATDLLYGGNERSRKAGLYYNQFPSQANGTGSQIIETTAAIEYASRLSTQIINSVLIPTPQPIANGVASTDPIVLATYDLLVNNKSFIQSESIQYISSSWSTAIYNQQSRSLDLGYIVDAVATDLLYGGNESSVNVALTYLLTSSLVTIEELESNVTTIDYAKGLASKLVESKTFVTASQNVSASVNLLRLNREFIQDETLAYLTASWSTFEYDKVKCRRDVGYILDSVTTDLLYGGNERSAEAGDFYYRYPSKAVIAGDGDGEGQINQTVDGINYASRLAQKIVQNTLFVTASLEASASFDLLRKNKSFIQNEVIAYVSSSWSGVYYNETTCKRDVGYLIDAAATDVLYGGQERSVIAGSYYYLYPSNAIKKGVPSTSNQLDPTLTGIRWTGKLAKKVIINPTFQSPSASLLTTVGLLSNNKTLIQKETIAFLSSSWSTLRYNEASCSRDLGFILDAIRTDLVYGGNERSIEAGSYYYKIPSVAIYESYSANGEAGQKKQTVDGINFAKGISQKLIANTLLTYLAPSTKRRQAADRLRAAKDELKQRAIGYTNGAFPYLVYNEASCSRDTGLIVDACCTDLLYGGNERGIAAASSYYNGQYGSAIAVTRDQRLETLETNRYLRTRAEFVAAGAPLEAFGSLIVATGIDYSYNGSGVTFKALPPNQGGSGVPDPIYEITELGGGRIFFTSGNQDGDFRIGTGLSINQATGTLVGRTFSKSLFSLVTPFSLALQI
jgi:hypothetical protein